MRPNQTLAGLTARCLTGLEEAINKYAPDCVVAQGDTTTVMAASLAAFYHRIPFVHVEAGLRTGDLQAPWPEEMNRRVAGIVADLHCAPTQRAADALLDGRDAARHRACDRKHRDRRTVMDGRPRTDTIRRSGKKNTRFCRTGGWC